MAFGDGIMAVGGCTVSFGLEGSSSISESLSCSAGSRVIFAGSVFSSWGDRVDSTNLTSRAMNTQPKLTSITRY